jgi:ribosomal protein L37AE/L43A
LSKPSNTLMVARASGRCTKCNEPAERRIQETPGGIKGVLWCNACDWVAFGGSSYFKPTESEKTSLRRLAPNHRPCEVCNQTAVLEMHHLAPRAQFGDECERWPKIDVCHDCHRRWEALMGTHPWRDAR